MGFRDKFWDTLHFRCSSTNTLIISPEFCVAAVFGSLTLSLSVIEETIMTKKEFINFVSNGQEDVLQELLDLLNEMKIDYCVIGGLAVNAYVEPVVSLDLDLVVFAEAIDTLLKAAEKIFNIERFSHSVNLSSRKSDLRIQLQTDPRYQTFIFRASIKEVMGYKMKVATLEDVLQGKIWAYSDEQRRKSKRQKDLADIFRLVETYSHLKDSLPESLKNTEF